MILREYKQSDCQEIAELFYSTVHKINSKDYTIEQLNVWATGNENLFEWNKSFLEHYTIVALDKNIIIGFGDIDNTGYLDRLYVHANFQRKGIGTAICDELERKTRETIITHASVTAKPFFESRGYHAIKKQKIERQGIYLTNYVMELRR